MPYAALLNRSFHSLLDGAMSPREIVDAALSSGMAAAGLADTDTVSGAVEFYKHARAAGLHPVIGSQVTLDSGHSIALLVENRAGYANLCRLLTTRIGNPRGAVWEDVARFRDGLICLLGPESEPAAAVRRNQPAAPALERYRDVFAGNLALAICPHNEEDLRLSRVFATLGRRLRIPIVAAADAHYRAPGDRLRYDILAAMRTLTLLGQPHPAKHGPGGYHFHTPAEIGRHFGALPQAIENSARIAARCRFEFELGDIRFPRFPLPEGETAIAVLRRLAEEGLARRYPPAPGEEARARLRREMAVIEQVGYADYFLIFHDIVRWANARGIATLARGSAAGSLVCYTLGISNVCPFRFGLCFERFLNQERMQFSKLADIDLDLPWDRRDEVVQYVFSRYGREHTAMIGALNTFQGRAAVADIAKVYGIPEREVRRFTERLPHFMGDPQEVVRSQPECRDLPVHEEPYRTVLAMAAQFEGLPRHRMMHPCGLVVSAGPVTDRMPLFESAKGLLTTHYTMDDVEELGLLKMDLLGQAGLSVLREAGDNLRENRGIDVDWDAVDWNDAATWETVATGQARGVFHIESPAMTSLLVMCGCRDIDCLTAVESIIRPGAANEGKKRAFARRHQGLEPVTYAHPSLEPLLKDTYGLMAYEEHILLVANGFAGLPWGRADLLRRALVKNKDRARIAALGEEFRAAAARRGRTPDEIEAVWALLEDFAGYMFNKAHSAAYAVEAFQGAWFKTRYPIEFLASVLTNRRGFYRPLLYVLEALRFGARFLPPDLHQSDPRRFLVRGDTVRLPLDQVKGLGGQTLNRIAGGCPFDDTGAFYRHVRPSRPEWMALMKVGALDGFGEPRGRLFWRLCRLEAMLARNSAQAPDTLFEPADPEIAAGGAPSPKWEHELLGFPVSCHPLEYFAPDADWSRYTSAEELRAHPARFFDREVDVCGLIVAERIHPTENGPMKFLTLADYTGFVEVSLFPDAYTAWGHMTTRPVVAVSAHAEPFDNRQGVALNATRVCLPARAAAPRQSAAPELRSAAAG